MASSSGSQKVDIPALRKELYDACKPLVAETPNLIFNQTSILDLDIIPGNDINILLAVTQGLVDEKKFKILQSDTLSWMVRSEEDARKLVNPPLQS
jgi:DNA-directed RNA polymerase III subunit RPC6